MAKKNEVALMVQGLGLALDFIRRLLTKISERGGYEEMIHFLTTERGEGTLNAIADFIVAAPWRVPQSLIERLAMKMAIDEPTDDVPHPEDHWGNAIESLGIPLIIFSSIEPSNEHPPIPHDVLTQLVGVSEPLGHHVMYDGKGCVVVYGITYGPQDLVGLAGEEVLGLVEERFIDTSR